MEVLAQAEDVGDAPCEWAVGSRRDSCAGSGEEGVRCLRFEN